ncbi:MAG: 1-deoxy-D-xylulose-5-phosphate reductoisomerase [Acidobacteria bacterium]|nr:MAG: 1-deoxy-D-xylulose-5-phosphate reductoisomerase [Acidobacteriota bacterium]
MSSATPRRVAILGATGSIGRNTLDVIQGLAGRFEITALAAGSNVAILAEQANRFRPQLLAVKNQDSIAALRQKLDYAPRILAGQEGLLAAASQCGADLVVAAVVGVAALEAISAALSSGCTVALANKEALVVSGAALLEAARLGRGRILPIDSEHSAVHQCLRAGKRQELARVILTASGGPFRTFTAAELAHVTPAQALRHPTWNMGTRVTLDSATLMNKGFEIMEACHLFGLEESQVGVLVHPQSIVHSLVEFADGSVIAQLGTADMRTPIQYALTYPDRLPTERLPLKLEEVGRLEFMPPDDQRFPCLELARQAWRAGGGAGAVLNAADEVALEAFVAGQIEFPAIARVVEETMQRMGASAISTVAEALACDRQAREVAASALAALC